MRDPVSIRAKLAELRALTAAHAAAGHKAKANGAAGPAADHRLQAAWGAQAVAALAWVLGEIEDPLYRVRSE